MLKAARAIVALSAACIVAVLIMAPGGGGDPPHALSVDAESGPTYGWEGNVNSTNTGNGNKLTSIPLFSWTAKGGCR